MYIQKSKIHLTRFLSSLFMLLILSACQSESSDKSLSVQDIALSKITAYAEDNTNEAPTEQDYIDAGVSGVTSDNLEELNAVVANLELTDVDTTEEIVALTANLNITLESRAEWGFNWDQGSVWQ